MDWIDVKAWPPVGEKLLLSRSGEVHRGRRIPAARKGDPDRYGGPWWDLPASEITHWRPLPLPPTEA